MSNGFFEGRDARLIVGIGSVLVDIVVPTSEAFVGRSGVPKGGSSVMSNDPPAVLYRRSASSLVPKNSPRRTAARLNRSDVSPTARARSSISRTLPDASSESEPVTSTEMP